MIRNIDRMYYNYGYGDGRTCYECPHFGKKCWNKRAEKKVLGYDNDGKEIVERKTFLSCGLINKPFPEESEQLKGQLSINEPVEGDPA